MTELPIIAKLHLYAGLITMAAGFIAILAPKGKFIHRWIGRIFLFTMGALCLSGFYLSITRSLQLTFFLAFFSAYLLFTGWYTMARRSSEANLIDKIGFALVTFGVLLSGGIATAGIVYDLPSPATEPPYQGYYVFTGFALILAVGDYLYIWKNNGTRVSKLIRHLWRMMFSLLIATFIFVGGNTHVLPEALRKDWILSMPVIAIIIAMVFWVFRVKKSRQSFTR
ncbi:hypothetical protein [Agaribacter marinus]|uniref:DUF2306 domain-containing protein n=1 Tax=Agaribacter marinus TaxID=1431249 RepID=A0AA37SUT4_9ALTE|nr:hypothetical protein [Agaribacter marinus]GLR69823.1 hypothetical protein GCM10007852_07310 [Agaribacter marinus]